MNKVSLFFQKFRRKHFSMSAEDMELMLLKMQAIENNNFYKLSNQLEKISVDNERMSKQIKTEIASTKNCLLELHNAVINKNDSLLSEIIENKNILNKIYDILIELNHNVNVFNAKNERKYQDHETKIDSEFKNMLITLSLLQETVNKGFDGIMTRKESLEKFESIISNFSVIEIEMKDEMLQQEMLVKEINCKLENVASREDVEQNLKELSLDINNIKCNLEEVAKREVAILQEENTALKQVVNDSISQLKTQMNLFKRQTHTKTLYHNPTERKALAGSFKQIMSDVNIRNKFIKLIKGLDEESITTVVRILQRMQIISDGNMALQDIYTTEELLELEKIRDDFASKIVKIDDNLFYYNGFYLPVNQFDSSVFYSKYGMHRLTTLGQIRNKEIIDAGGYVGDTAILLSPLTDKTVHVFEASPANASIIQETIKLNSLTNISLIEKALTNHSGEIQLSLGERNSCNSVVERQGYSYTKRILVPAITLDDYVKENNLQIGLIKVDIEGGEQLLLEGARETIRNQKPIIMISIYHSATDFFEIKPILEELCPDYTFRIVKPINSAIAIETILLAEVEKKQS